MKVLVVDDDPVLRGVLRRLLQDLCDDVLMASDGHEGLRHAKTEHPDLVLLDIQLPGMDGFDTLRALRALPECRDVPVICLTSRSNEADVKQMMELGVSDYMLKPIRPDAALERFRLTVEKIAAAKARRSRTRRRP